jgi:hypothetical protein
LNDDLKQRVLALDDHEWLLLLSRLAHYATVMMRGCYPHVVNGDPPPDDYEKWQWLNEMIHGLTGQLVARIDGRAMGRYADDLHLASIFEAAGRAESIPGLNDGYARVLASIEARPNGA